MAVTSECFDLLLVSLASNKSQQHISSQSRQSGHTEDIRARPGTLGDSWAGAGVGPNYYQSSSLIVVLLIMPGPASHHYPGSRGGHLALAYRSAAKIIRGICQQTIQILPSFFPIFCVAKYKEDEGIYFSHTKGRMGVYYKFDNKIFITKIKCG